jgi:hypothetical protein
MHVLKYDLSLPNTRYLYLGWQMFLLEHSSIKYFNLSVCSLQYSLSENHQNHDSEVHVGHGISHTFVNSKLGFCNVYIIFDSHCLSYMFAVCIHY